MLALWIHLLIVHLSVIAAVGAAGTCLWAWRRSTSEAWSTLCIVVGILAVVTAGAHESGPPTRAHLESLGAIAEGAVNAHAKAALVFYLIALGLGALGLQTLLSGALRDGVASWRKILFAGGLLLLVASGLLTAHRGGSIRRPELRGVAGPLMARGSVFADLNHNRHRDAGEAGVARVAVSNGRSVVTTDEEGRWQIPIRPRDTLFISQPSAYRCPPGPDGRPAFYYQYFPQGSPSGLDYPGIDPTGPLPDRIDFPLWEGAASDSFDVVCLADTQSKTELEFDYLRDDVLEEWKTIPTRSAIICGDLLYDELDLGPRLQQLMGSLDRPWWPIAGNHELNLASPEDSTSLETYQRLFGPPNYSWNSGRVHFVALDDVVYEGIDPDTGRARYRGAFTGPQIRWLEADLAVVPGDWLVVLCVHIPLRTEVDAHDPTLNVLDATAILEILHARKHRLILAGHLHQNEQLYLGVDRRLDPQAGVHQITLPAACGGWWSGHLDSRGIPQATQRDGSPNGSVLLSFEGPRYRSRFLPASEPNSPPLHWTEVEGPGPEERRAIVNYHAGGPRSRIAVDWGDGVLRELQRQPGVDPRVRSIYAQQRDSIPEWIEALPTTHLWTGILPSSARKEQVVPEFEITDEYGAVRRVRVPSSR